MSEHRACPRRRRRRQQDRRRAADRWRRRSWRAAGSGRPTSIATRPRGWPRSTRAWRAAVRVRPACRPTAAAPRTVISAGLAGASGATQRQAFAAAFPSFAARRLSSDGYTAFLGVFGTAPGRTALDRHRRRRLPLRSRAARRRSAAAGASRWPTAAAAPGSASAWPASISTIWTARPPFPAAASGPPPPRPSAPEREAILGWLAGARAAEFAALAPAVVAAADCRRSAGRGAARRGCRPPAAARPSRWRRAPARRSASGAASPTSTARGSRRALPGRRSCRPAAGPTRLRGAWLVATGAVPPEYPDVA